MSDQCQNCRNAINEYCDCEWNVKRMRDKRDQYMFNCMKQEKSQEAYQEEIKKLQEKNSDLEKRFEQFRNESWAGGLRTRNEQAEQAREIFALQAEKERAEKELKRVMDLLENQPKFVYKLTIDRSIMDRPNLEFIFASHDDAVAELLKFRLARKQFELPEIQDRIDEYMVQ